jgi:hypothetical protein
MAGKEIANGLFVKCSWSWVNGLWDVRTVAQCMAIDNVFTDLCLSWSGDEVGGSKIILYRTALLDGRIPLIASG